MDGKPDAASVRTRLPIYERSYRAVNGKHTTIYPGVREGLDLLRAQGFPLVCVTNKSERFTLPLLDYVSLSGISRPWYPATRCRRKSPIPRRCCMPASN